MIKHSLCLLLVALTTGCATLPPSISTNAQVERISTGCRISISGQFSDMAHDPASLLLAGRSQIVASFDVPLLAGRFDAQQIHVTYRGETGEPWEVKGLSGDLVLNGTSVTIDFLSHDPVEPVRDFDFNGSFTFANPQACA